MRFYGSAMPFPHIQGAFRELISALPAQCVLADGLAPEEAAMAEPLSVVLHAVRLAGNLVGKRVLISGCGPIGLLAILAARRAGAGEIVATDITERTLSLAAEVGADVTLNVAETRDALAPWTSDKGQIDVLFECSGAEAALAGAIPALRPRADIIQIGLSGDMTLPMMQITAKEIGLRGSFRFHEEFATAVGLMQKRLIDVRPLLSHTFPLAQFQEAFDTASDKSRAVKVQIAFV
jgi:L-idonate 5-dehydrogenase